MSFLEKVSELRSVISRDELLNWREKNQSAPADLKLRALLAYVEDWLSLTAEEQEFRFSSFISEDLSSIMLGNCPVIFLGTNEWATKRYLSVTEVTEVLSKWNSHFQRITSDSKVPVFTAIVPEKDAVLRKLLGKRDLSNLQATIERFIGGYAENLAGYSFMQWIDYPPEPSVANYEYYDSHLLSRDYLRIYIDAMSGLGLRDKLDIQRITMKRTPAVGDLAAKLTGEPFVESNLELLFTEGNVQRISGDETFGEPLRSTRQEFSSSNPIVDAKVAIYGDSHSSIYDKRKLTYLFANTFARCEFFWDPLCLNNKTPVEDADYVVLEIAQRFMV